MQITAAALIAAGLTVGLGALVVLRGRYPTGQSTWPAGLPLTVPGFAVIIATAGAPSQ